MPCAAHLAFELIALWDGISGGPCPALPNGHMVNPRDRDCVGLCVSLITELNPLPQYLAPAFPELPSFRQHISLTPALGHLQNCLNAVQDTDKIGLRKEEKQRGGGILSLSFMSVLQTLLGRFLHHDLEPWLLSS